MLEEPLKMASSHDHTGGPTGGYQAGLHSPPPAAPPSPPPEAPTSPQQYPSPAEPPRPRETSSPDYSLYGFGAGHGGFPVPVYLDKPREVEERSENGHPEPAPSPPPASNGHHGSPRPAAERAGSPPPVEPGSPPADWPRTDSVLRFGDRLHPPPSAGPERTGDGEGDCETGTEELGSRTSSSPPAPGTETDQRPEGDTAPAPGFNALQRLQHALEQNGTFSVYGEESPNGGGGGGGTEIYQCHLCTYTGSSKFHFSQHMHSHYDFKCSQCDFSTHSNVSLKEHMKTEHNIEIKDYMDEPGVRVPRVNASGKVRLHKCKFCEFKTATQVEHWEHLKGHIAPEKRFWCHVCPFITDVKHHLTYHLRNHFNSKPFKCNKCEYSCVNKSMLSSHMKSHTNLYQYRCGDCNFAAKYANALKNHLRKEKHRPGMVLNPDGSPNPFVIIDVYGTRRGPKIKKDDNGMPILPSSLQENYVNFIQTQNKYITSPTNPCNNFSSPYLKSEPPLDAGEGKLALPRGYIRCDMCPYSTPDREQLTRHMMNHMTPDSQQPEETSPASSKSGDEVREPPPPPPPSGLGRMELLRSALAQPVRLPTSHLSMTASPPPPPPLPPPPPPPAYRRPEPSEPAAPRLPQYDSLAAHRVREYFSRALQSPLLYNLSMAAGLNGAPPPAAGLPLPFSMTRPPPQPAPSPPHTRVVSPRPSSPPFYERPPPQSESPQPSSPPAERGDVALDLSRLGKRSSSDESPPPPTKHRRKGRAQKLELISQRLQEAGGSPQHSAGSRERSSSPERGGEEPTDWRSGAHTCHNCGIAFKDLVMYTMHMGFHDYRRPFSCNKCGEQCRDAIAFFLHIARVPHSS
ncbi:protein hunchback-like [Amphibalanus amphitrite]|uniref:protein hunchback-like n=1 Tax=Amphibalanus amphitrite TaxID=1232801 RepID=UPI001C901667|nr:protein hunchback-like [Amphibalanus amphitrite]